MALLTPDRRYIVVRGRLWRAADPNLTEPQRTRFVAELMAARRAVRDARAEPDARKAASARVDAAKHALGFFDVSSDLAEVWLPDKKGGLRIAHSD